MNIKIGQKIVFDTYDRVKTRLIVKNIDSANDNDIYGIPKYVYKEHFENKHYIVKHIKDGISFEIFDSGYVFDESFIKRNMININDSLFKL